MGRLLNVVTPLHKRTKRDYLARMQDEKIHCMIKAKEYGLDYWDGDRRYGYGGYRYDGRWKVVAEQLIESYGLRVSDGDRTLAYSADSAPCDGLVELAREADLFLCEATLAQPEPGIRGHLTADEALDAYASSGAKRFVVIHRPDELPLPDGVERAYDGLKLDV